MAASSAITTRYVDQLVPKGFYVRLRCTGGQDPKNREKRVWKNKKTTFPTTPEKRVPSQNHFFPCGALYSNGGLLTPNTHVQWNEDSEKKSFYTLRRIRDDSLQGKVASSHVCCRTNCFGLGHGNLRNSSSRKHEG